MPFDHKPGGMSPEVLALLDAGLTSLWLDQVANRAVQLGASAEAARDLRQHFERLMELSRRQPVK